MARGINTINGIDYVYEYKSNWNAELHRSEQKRDYIGKIRDGVFVPNRIYQMRMELEALKRQNGLPSDSDERPLEEELSELIRKHNEHKAKLAEKKTGTEKPEKKSSAHGKKTESEPEKAVASDSEVTTAVKEAPEAEKTMEVEPVPVVEEDKAPLKETAEPEPETQPVHKTAKHVLRVGELDDEEFGPDLFNVQPSVAPVEDEPEEIPVVEEEEEEDEDPDLFAFADDVEKFIADEEPISEVKSEEAMEKEPVAEPMPESEAVSEVEPADAAEAESVAEDKPLEEASSRKSRKAKNRKEKKEEDNGQLFLF